MKSIDRNDINVDIIFKPTSKLNMNVEEIILMHKEISDIYGSTWLGTNQNFSEDKIREIDKNGYDIRVLFVSNENDDREHRVIYSAELIDITTYANREKGSVRYHNNLVPLYYILDTKRCWLKLTNFKKVRGNKINIRDYKLLFREDEVKVEESLRKGQCCLMYAYREII